MKKIVNTFLMVLTIISLLFVSAFGSGVQVQAEDSGSPVTIKVAYKDDGPSNENSVKYYETLSENIKVDLGLDVTFELVELAQGNYAEKLSLLLNSGEIPDLIYFQGADEQMANQGILEDLTPYIESSENINNILQPHNETRLANYPYLLWIKPIDHKVPVVRQNVINELESGQALLDDPSIENYRAFFQEMVDGGHSDYAVTVAGDLAELDYIFDFAFGINKTWLESDDGYVFNKVSQQEKEKLAFYNELYEAGLLDSEYLTKQWDTKEDAFYNGQAGVIVGTNGKVIDFYNTRTVEVNGEDAELMVLPPASGIHQGYSPVDVTKESRGLAISSLSENKDVVFQVLDYLASPEGQMLDSLGYEGTHYEIVDEEIQLTDQFGEWYARYWEPADQQFPLSISEETPLLSGPAQSSVEMVNSYYEEDNNFTIPEELITQWDAMENLYREYSADIVTGRISIDEFDTFVEEWYAAGGTQLTELANETIE